jgi:hypothetical protein
VPAELATVTEDEAVVFEGPVAYRYQGLVPGVEQRAGPFHVRTLPRPPGERLATVATVNDLHFGEIACGVLRGLDLGPVLRAEPGQEPYPLVMNRAAVAEIAALAPDAVVAKGDLTSAGTPAQYEQFTSLYATAFGDRLVVTPGNHDHPAQPSGPLPFPAVEARNLPGVTLAVLDTSRPGVVSGAIDDEQAEWLDDLAAGADRPILVFGHHPVADDTLRGQDGSPIIAAGLDGPSADRLAAVVVRRPALVGYFAGHTHRNKVRYLAGTGPFPWVEVACVKDFPGSWAEYRVFEGGILQAHRRVHQDPAAIAWSERCRCLFGGLYPSYAWGSVSDRCFEIGLREPAR